MFPSKLRVQLLAAAAVAAGGASASAVTGGVRHYDPLGLTAEITGIAMTQQRPYFLILDEDAIDNGSPPNFFSETDVNDDLAALARRTELRFFDLNKGDIIKLHSGTVGDEGWFAVKVIPNSWAAAGPTSSGLENYMGNNRLPYPHNVGPGLGTGEDPEVLLDQIPLITPLRATGLDLLVGSRVCAVVYDGDIGINYGPLTGNLQGHNLGTVAFEVLDVRELPDYSTGSLPEVTIRILDANKFCQARFQQLFLNAPEPESSSEPFDTVP